MSQPEGHEIESAVAALEKETGAQTEAWRQRLDRARREALQGRRRPVPRRWAWAGAAAGLALAVVLLVGLPQSGDNLAQPPVAEADLYEDMEFYLWLAKELDSPSPSRS